MSVIHSEAGPSNWQQHQPQPHAQHHHHQSIQPLRTDPLRQQPLIPSASYSSSPPQNGLPQAGSYRKEGSLSDGREGAEGVSGSGRVVRVDGSSWGVLPPEAPRSYTPVKLVGDGSFGTVWLCDWHSPLPKGTTLSPMQCGAGARAEWAGKRLVAVKRMKRVWERGWEEAGKLKELESLRSIPSHPNIIPLYDAFLQPSKELYFVFECMEGNLYQLTKSRKGRPLAGGLIASIFHQVISGLEHVHRWGYFHRDMKPENLLVTTIGLQDYTPVKEERALGDGAGGGKPPGRMETDVVVIVKLADFGLAREIESKPPYTEYVSTRWYRAPEVLLRSRDYGPAVDMWALGTILAELVNLKPLFPGQSEVDQVYKICTVLGDPSREYGLDERGKVRGGGDWDRGIKMARAVGFGFPKMAPVPFGSLFDPTTPLTLIDVISECIRYNPKHRITAKACLSHAYFTETVPKIQTAPYIPPMPEAPAPSTLASRPTQPHLASTASATALISPPDSVQSNGSRDIPPSHSIHHQPYALPKPNFSLGDPSRTLPFPQPSNSAANRVFYPHYRESHSSSPGLPTSPDASTQSLQSRHSQQTLYDAPGLEHSLASGSTLVHGGARDRTSGASSLVDRLRELDLPAADLSSYGRRAPPANVRANDFSPLSIPHWQQHAQQYQTQQPSTTSLPSMNGSQQHIPSLENYGQPNFMAPHTTYDQSLSSIATRSTHASSTSYIDIPPNSVDPSSYHPPQLQRTPYDNDRSMPPPPPLNIIDEPVRRQDVVMANAQVEANKRALAAPPKKKKWGLGSVFGSSSHSNDSKYSQHGHLASVGEETVSSLVPVSLKRSQSVSSNGGLEMAGGIPLDPKAAAKEAKKAAKQLELAKREAASAAAKERARAVMQKRDRLVNEQAGKSGSQQTASSSFASVAQHKGKATASQTSLERPHIPGSSSQGSLSSSRSAGTNTSLLSSHQQQEQHRMQQSPSGLPQQSSPSGLRHVSGSSSTPTVNSSGSSATSFRNDPLALAESQRHKSRRRDGDDDHSTSSYNPSRSSFRSPSIMTFASIDSDPGPKPSSRLYPPSLGFNRATSSSASSVLHHHPSLQHASSPQLYSLPHGSSGTIENQLARDFRDGAKLASSSSSSLGYVRGGAGGGYGQDGSTQHQHGLYGRSPSQSSRLNLVHPSESSSGANSPSPSGGYVNPMFQVVDPTTHSNSHNSGTTLPPFSHIASVADRHQYNHHPHRSPPRS